LINEITIKMFDVEASFNDIKNIEQNIAYNVSKGNYDIAIKIQLYCVPLFKEIKNLLRNSFFVELDRSPLKVKYDEVLNVLENCIKYNEIQLLKDLEKDNEREPQQPEISKPKVKDYKKELWFITGIPLATGEAFNLFRKYKGARGCFERICEDLKIVRGRPYISTTLSDSKPKEVFNRNGIKMPMKISDKNTFADKDKLQKLHTYLAENKLPFGAEFLEKYNQIETE